MKWRKVFFFAVLQLVFTSGVLASSACSSGTLADYEALPAGCTIGPSPTFTFSNFGFAVLSSSGGASVLNATQIEVTPLYSNLDLQLSFASTGFAVSSGQSVQYMISYTVDPPPPEIVHFASQLRTDPPVFPGIAQVTSNLCLYAAFTGNSCNTPGVPFSISVFDNGITSSLNATTPNFSPFAVLMGVHDVITLNATSGGGLPTLSPAGGSASFTSFGNTTSVTPEPTSVVLSVCGLGLLFVLTRGAQAKSG